MYVCMCMCMCMSLCMYAHQTWLDEIRSLALSVFAGRPRNLGVLLLRGYVSIWMVLLMYKNFKPFLNKPICPPLSPNFNVEEQPPWREYRKLKP